MRVNKVHSSETLVRTDMTASQVLWRNNFELCDLLCYPAEQSYQYTVVIEEQYSESLWYFYDSPSYFEVSPYISDLLHIATPSVL